MFACTAVLLNYLLQIHWNEHKCFQNLLPGPQFSSTSQQGEKVWASTMSIFLFHLLTLIKVVQDVCPQIWSHPNTCKFDPTLGGFGGIVAVPKASTDLTRPLLKCLHFYGKLQTTDGSKPSEKDTRLIQRLVKENSCKWALLWHFRFLWIL